MPRKRDRRPARIFGDIDLVLKAPRVRDAWPDETYREQTFRTERNRIQFRTHINVTFSPTVVRTLDRIRRDSGADWVWHSTWVEQPDDIVRLTSLIRGLHGGDFVKKPRRNGLGELTHGWKAERIVRYMNEHGPTDFVVLDDELWKWQEELEEYADTHHIRFLPVVTDGSWATSPGLEPHHLRAIESFLSADRIPTA
ncbi:HAD domain-containing protein [Curtobacterium sp. MCSS17_016]|uniref:HAD domain-containing protein n=1 Tax=Curtobacterium sp. MCSS17_016 TaxID=2175644 RepID=UPI000DA71601|nr:HAD domain-containing protein [Curtobacterium sp. MCSS17_016]WIE81238.1 HAD domain-containing protein [Curtobacterium sp. MCSS17_016]